MARIAMYAGHGGADPGAIGVNGLREKDLTLAVSNAASAILRGWGYTVLNNRIIDEDRSITRDANLANDWRADALVEIHMNSNAGTPATGSEAFISIRELPRARTLGDAMLRRLQALGFANRGVKTAVNANGQDTFGILRLTQMPAVLLECAFINNPADMARFNVSSVAQAVAEGIREVFPISTAGGGLPAYPGTPLRVGSSGESVRQVQRCLNRIRSQQPSIGALTEDGVFGARTQASVTAFQRISGLNHDGVVGPLTWARLSQECGGSSGGGLPAYPGTALRTGSSGESVRQAQHCLNQVAQRHPSIGMLTADGIFGARTQASVIAFQRIFGLSPDGVVGPQTWARLAQECSAGGLCACEGEGESEIEATRLTARDTFGLLLMLSFGRLFMR